MSFNTIEYLKKGKVDFVFSLTPYDYENLIQYIRKSNERDIIISGFLEKLIDKYYRFCFAIIYDMDKYQEQTLYILNKYLGFNYLTKTHLLNILHNTTWGKEFIKSHLTEIIQKDEDILTDIFAFIFQDLDNNYDLIKIFYLHNNLHIRYLFMAYIIEHHHELINIIYDDFTKYLTSVTYQEYEQLTFLPTLMDMEDICNLAILSYQHLPNKNIWLHLKEYILTNYPENTLAGKLLQYDHVKVSNSCYSLVENPDKIKEFNQDANRLFQSSIDYKLIIYNHYSENVSKELLEQFAKIIALFRKKDTGKLDANLDGIYYYHLGHKLQQYIEKYLDLSHSKETGYINSGATLSCYRLGDYVIKLVRTKWSYEDIICPNLYLIAKNYEEDYIRDKHGIVVAGIEVQKYLSRPATNVPSYVFTNFSKELQRFGYYSMDTLINGVCGDNCMLLDSYKDADVNPHTKLPNWFIQYPMVLVDRDDIYKLENTYPKNRHSCNY